MSASWTTAKRLMVWDKAKGLCHWCTTPMLVPDTPPDHTLARRMTMEHITPKSKQGSDKLRNLTGAHAFCNLVRGNIPHDKFPESWREVLRIMFTFEEYAATTVTMAECYTLFGRLRREMDCVRF